MVVVTEQTFPIYEEVPDDEHVYAQNNEHERGEPVDQFINFNRNEKSRLANGHIPRPTYAKHQAEPFHEREHAVDQCAESRDHHVALGQLTHFYRQISPKLSFGI